PPRPGAARSLEQTTPLADEDAGAGRAAGARDPGAAACRAAPDRLGARARPLERARHPAAPRPIAPPQPSTRTGRPLRTRPARPAAAHRRQETRPHQTPPQPRDRAAHRQPRPSGLGLPLRLRRRPHPHRPRRPLPRRNNPQRPRLPRQLPTLLPTARHRDQAAAHRQRQELPTPMAQRLPAARDRAAPHPAAPTTHKRQSRTLHPHPPHRMGPRTPLPQQPPPRKRSRLLPHPLQHPTPPPRPQRPHTTPTAVNNLPGTYNRVRPYARTVSASCTAAAS